LLLVAKTEKC